MRDKSGHAFVFGVVSGSREIRGEERVDRDVEDAVSNGTRGKALEIV